MEDAHPKASRSARTACIAPIPWTVSRSQGVLSGKPARSARDEVLELGDIVPIDDPGPVESALANPLEDGDADGLAVREGLFLDLGDVGPQ